MDIELRELIRQGLIVDEVHEVLLYDRKNMPWIDNFINLSIKLKNQCDDPREKAYQAFRHIFGMGFCVSGAARNLFFMSKLKVKT